MEEFGIPIPFQDPRIMRTLLPIHMELILEPFKFIFQNMLLVHKLL